MMSRNKTGRFYWKGKMVLAMAAALLVLSGCQKSGGQSVEEKIGELQSNEAADEESRVRSHAPEDEETKKLYDEENK